MGNYFSNEIQTEKIEVDPLWMKKLRSWEREIQIKNSLINTNSNNSPLYLKQLNSWADEIKFNNFKNNSNCNNAPFYILNLRKENELLHDTNNEFKQLYL